MRLAVNDANIYNIFKEGGVKALVGIISGFMDNEKVYRFHLSLSLSLPLVSLSFPPPH